MSAAELLLSHGAAVSVPDNDGWTALHFAAACDNVDLVQLLLNVSLHVHTQTPI